MLFYDIPDVEISGRFSWEIEGVLSRKLAIWLIHKPPMDYLYPSNKCKELAIFIKFLNACYGSQINVRGTIKNPQGKQVKGANMEVSISEDNPFMCDLLYFANTMLEQYQDGRYQCEFGWDFKEKIELQDVLGRKEEHPFYTKWYAEEELDCIINYENEEESRRISKRNGKLGFIASYMLEILQKVEGFKTKTKMYSFVYDVMLIGGFVGGKCIEDDGFSGDVGEEKYQEVRNWVTAYNKEKLRK